MFVFFQFLLYWKNLVGNQLYVTNYVKENEKFRHKDISLFIASSIFSRVLEKCCSDTCLAQVGVFLEVCVFRLELRPYYVYNVISLPYFMVSIWSHHLSDLFMMFIQIFGHIFVLIFILTINSLIFDAKLNDTQTKDI